MWTSQVALNVNARLFISFTRSLPMKKYFVQVQTQMCYHHAQERLKLLCASAALWTADVPLSPGYKFFCVHFKKKKYQIAIPIMKRYSCNHYVAKTCLSFLKKGYLNCIHELLDLIFLSFAPSWVLVSYSLTLIQPLHSICSILSCLSFSLFHISW